MTPLLSILIPTIPEREDLFLSLYFKLKKQVEKHPEGIPIEILWNYAKKFTLGGPSIGRKRQSLLDIAEGRFLLYLDDDEDIAPHYIETLIELCKQDKDVCTFKSFIQLENYWGIVNMRLRYLNEQMTPDEEVRRSPWHMCPIRSSIAKKYKFDPDKNYGEDALWMSQVLNDIKTEAHSDRIIHSYRHNQNGNRSVADEALAFQQNQK